MKSSFIPFLLICMVATIITAEVTRYTVPGKVPVVCTDTLANLCIADTQCASLGTTDFQTGNNFNFETVSTFQGQYIIRGGYTIRFPINCTITCQGDCSCPNCTGAVQITTENLNEYYPNGDPNNFRDIGTNSAANGDSSSALSVGNFSMMTISLLAALVAIWYV